MASTPIYTFPRGEPVIIGRRVLDGDPAGYTLFADLKPTSQQLVPKASVPVLASFAVTFVAAAPGAAAHWLLTIAAGLPVGQYVADGRFMKAGQVVQITGPAWIMITESVSG